MIFLVVLSANFWIEHSTKGKTFNKVALLPYNKVGLVLGTTPYLVGGRSNPYFKYRVQAVVDLYKSGKIDYILVSGDNSTHRYNEPKSFKKELIKRGIPAEHIILDYAGFRTLDSIVRAKKVFGLDSVTIISQKFHNQRAVYLANTKGLKAVGYNAKDVPFNIGIKVQLREYLARTKVFLDLLFGVQPKFLGEKIHIPD